MTSSQRPQSGTNVPSLNERNVAPASQMGRQIAQSRSRTALPSTQRITVRFTRTQYNQIVKFCDLERIGFSDFFRVLVGKFFRVAYPKLKRKPPLTAPFLNKVAKQLYGLGNNLNQALKLAHTMNRPVEIAQIKKTLAELQRIRMMIEKEKN